MERPLKGGAEKGNIVFLLESSYVSDQLMSWGRGALREDFGKIVRGNRYSPSAIRELIGLLHYHLIDENTNIEFYDPNKSLLSTSSTFYGMVMNIISPKDNETFGRKPIEDKFQTGEDNLWQQTAGLLFRNDAKQMAKDITIIRKANPESKIVLFSGKWNGFPHLGQMFFIDKSLKEIHSKNPDTQLYAIVACDTNRSIQRTGALPFLNTLWRMSLISYLPNVNGVFCSGNFDQSSARRHWRKIYNLIKPDFVPVEIGDLLTEKKSKLAMEIGATPVEINPKLLEDESFSIRVSSTGLLNNSLNIETVLQQYSKFKPGGRRVEVIYDGRKIGV